MEHALLLIHCLRLLCGKGGDISMHLNVVARGQERKRGSGFLTKPRKISSRALTHYPEYISNLWKGFFGQYEFARSFHVHKANTRKKYEHFGHWPKQCGCSGSPPQRGRGGTAAWEAPSLVWAEQQRGLNNWLENL